MNIVCECSALEVSWMIHDILHSVEAVDDFGAERRVHVERGDHTWNQNPIIFQRLWRDSLNELSGDKANREALNSNDHAQTEEDTILLLLGQFGIFDNCSRTI